MNCWLWKLNKSKCMILYIYCNAFTSYFTTYIWILKLQWPKCPYKKIKCLLKWTVFMFLWWQAAMDFVVEEDLKAHLTCWYIQKYVKENPQPQYFEHIYQWPYGQRRAGERDSPGIKILCGIMLWSYRLTYNKGPSRHCETWHWVTPETPDLTPKTSVHSTGQ